MYGEVYVEYTGIGGTNMDSGIMTADMQGSSAEGTEGQTRPAYNVAWVFPGGITGEEGATGGLWGYLLQPMTEGGTEIYDADLARYLAQRGYIEWTDPDTTTINVLNESAARNEINSLLNAYVRRLMQYDLAHPNGNMGMARFTQEFGKCMRVV